MNKPIEQRSPNAPAQAADQAQKGGAASGNQPFYKTNPSSQKQGEPQAANKGEQPQQKLAQGKPQVVSQGPKKS